MRALTWIAVPVAALGCSSADEPGGPRFAPLGAEEVRDSHLELVWMARDSGRELSWLDADRHCRELAAGSSGAGWRLPSIEELAALYDPSMEQPCGEAVICRIDPAIDLTSPYQWSATARQPNRRVYYDFSFGSQLAPLIRPTLTRRALCTRDEPGEGEQRRRQGR